jgi:hypothetical protein
MQTEKPKNVKKSKSDFVFPLVKEGRLQHIPTSLWET